MGDPTTKEEKPRKDRPKKEKPKARQPADNPVAVAAGDPRKDRICWDFRDHGTCRRGRDCPFSHDKDLRKKELEKKGSGKGADGSYPARNQGQRSESRGRDKKKGQGKGREASRGASPKDRRSDRSQKPCPFFHKKGACKKGSASDMSHSLPVTTTTGTASTSGGGVPQGWNAPSGSGLSNPFHAFTVVACGPTLDAVKEPAAAAGVFAAAARPDGVEGKKGCFTDLDRLPKDWWHVVDNDKGGYQYKTVTKILGKKVETLLDGGAGSNHVTEELVVSILNHAASLGIKPNSPEFPVVRFEQWIYPEYVHGIASGSPVPLKGAVVLKVRLQEGPDESSCKDGHEIYVRCKIAARGTSDWHGLILGGRALDCEARRGLGFRPGPGAHILDSLGVQIPRCEDHSAERKDRAYVFESVVSAVESTLSGVNEPGAGKRALLVFAGDEEVHLLPGEGALVPVVRSGEWVADVALTEAVLPVDGKVEAVPGLWDTGRKEGMVLVTPKQEEVCLESGDAVAELRSGYATSGLCQCGSMDTVFGDAHDPTYSCQDCGGAQVPMTTQ